MKKEELITGTYFYVHHMCKILHLLVCNSLKEFFVIKKKNSLVKVSTILLILTQHLNIFLLCVCVGVLHTLYLSCWPVLYSHKKKKNAETLWIDCAMQYWFCSRH